MTAAALGTGVPTLELAELTASGLLLLVPIALGLPVRAIMGVALLAAVGVALLAAVVAGLPAGIHGIRIQASRPRSCICCCCPD